ncbi:hypothetical protein CJF31_00004245 [Rutstroemia sp. NJR-2017a BVV2]|nr:hypothetical protein CJF31_00002169 [Rutstroemia sp. NJR-2017a BVV2]PQE09395.1 hypothetical protein CJF31_00004245 [Rutstroemia sp. NJR-2017a BVV2]
MAPIRFTVLSMR